MADPICLQLCRVLCANGGAMELGQLGGALRLTPERMSRLLEAEEGHSLVLRSRGPDRVAVYASPLRMCANRNQDCAGDCGRLHLCRYFMLGGCSRPHCKFSHSIDDQQVAVILRTHHLTGVSIPELRHLLLQNDPSLLPDVCLHYNRGEGPYGSCTFKSCCNKLHVCQHLLQGDCKFGSKCKRSHDLSEEETKRKLQKWGLAAALLPTILEIYLNANAIKSGSSSAPEPKSPDTKDIPVIRKSASPQKSADPQPIDEICLYFVLNNCSFRERCVRDHYHLPYRWQRSIDGVWKDLENMEAIEQAYCDPNGRNSTLDFGTMTYKSCKLRRLSTPSSVSKPPHFILTTQWLWYWKDEYDKWVEYGKETDVHRSSSTITNSDLENVFLSDTKANVQFKAGKQNYVLSFKDMMQRNTKYGTERPVCRRPRFVSAEDVKEKKLRKSEPSKTNDKSPIPQHWDKGQVPDVGYKLVHMDQSSEEYKTIAAMIHRTLPDKEIQSIKRIQNLALWEVYQWQKEQMKKLNGGKDVNERQLFHGTKSDLDAICNQNFDWRICGTNGTAYGKGSYFARDAAYSDRYSRTDSSVCDMFVARVLVGESTRGSSLYLRPPLKTSPSTFYDSCVDSLSNPSIFVIFEKHQIYPEYVIRYTERQSMSALSSALRRAFW
ncbi:protein mono-ADP-ribosyltransferase PARP12-like isoform X2 [Dendropsophus ebraccatus]|uniref:protein mono-ADP-ribosyltransferase PARP12-like isoform X2 n=1 Tax=Dendropsophus ebraccatus TaxID=150705 RepID=UPI003831BED8